MTEKQQIEKATAQTFLDLYNSQNVTKFEIHELADTPDVICRDQTTGEELKLEITLLEDLLGEVRYKLGRGNQPNSPTTGSPVRSFYDDVVPQLQRALEKKLMSSYGSRTALVIQQVSPLWGPTDWKTVVDRIRNDTVHGREGQFGAGIWIICTDSSTLPASNALFCISGGASA